MRVVSHCRLGASALALGLLAGACAYPAPEPTILDTAAVASAAERAALAALTPTVALDGHEPLAIADPDPAVNGGATLVHPGGATLVHLTLCGMRCWGVVPVVHRRDPRCFV